MLFCARRKTASLDSACGSDALCTISVRVCHTCADVLPWPAVGGLPSDRRAAGAPHSSRGCCAVLFAGDPEAGPGAGVSTSWAMSRPCTLFAPPPGGAPPGPAPGDPRVLASGTEMTNPCSRAGRWRQELGKAGTDTAGQRPEGSMAHQRARLLLVGNGTEGTGPALSLSVVRVAEFSQEETPLVQVRCPAPRRIARLLRDRARGGGARKRAAMSRCAYAGLAAGTHSDMLRTGADQLRRVYLPDSQ